MTQAALGLASLFVIGNSRPIDTDTPGVTPGPIAPPTIEFVLGFAELRDQLGIDVMGWPVEAEHAAHDADAVQRTTRGLAVWRRGHPPMFTNGAQTFSLEKPNLVAAAAPASDGLDRLVDCVIWSESRGNPTAVNKGSGASGLAQFLPSTWKTTPYAAYSIFDPVANRAAAKWMIQVGRGKEFSTLGGCR